MINVLLGGALYHDLPAQFICINPLFHNQYPPSGKPVPKIELAAGNPLASCFGTGQIAVNSCYHQGIRALSPALAPMAASPDGLIEAAWMPDLRFAWGAQRNPERMEQDIYSQKLLPFSKPTLMQPANACGRSDRSRWSGAFFP